MPRLIMCIDCQEKKELCAKGLCKTCYNRHWRKKNPDCDRIYNEKHREERRISSLRWYREHREERLVLMRRYHQEHRKEVLERQRRYRHKHRAENVARSRQWRKDNPEKHKAQHVLYRIRSRKQLRTLTSKQAERLLAIGRATWPGEDLHLDHVVPLSKGGGTTSANVHAIPASLNQLKHDALPEEIYQQRKLI